MNFLNYGSERIQSNEKSKLETKELLECKICRKVLIDPVKCYECYNHVCGNCLSSCCIRRKDNFLEPDKKVLDELYNLIFNCRNSSRGCHLGLSRIEMIKHEESCPFNKYCDKCCSEDLKPVEHFGIDSHSELSCVKEQIDAYARWTAKAIQIIISMMQVKNPISEVVKEEAARVCEARPSHALSTLSNMGGLKIINNQILENLGKEIKVLNVLDKQKKPELQNDNQDVNELSKLQIQNTYKQELIEKQKDVIKKQDDVVKIYEQIKEQKETIEKKERNVIESQSNVIQKLNDVKKIYEQIIDYKEIREKTEKNLLNLLDNQKKPALQNDNQDKYAYEFNELQIRDNQKQVLIEKLQRDVIQNSNDIKEIHEKIEKDKYNQQYYKAHKMCNNGHDLILNEKIEISKICDFCVKEIFNEYFYNCNQGCDYDWCFNCYNK